MTSVRVFVPGSIGNVGPGFDVLGLAVDGIGDRFTVELTTAPSSIAVVTGRDHTLSRPIQQTIVLVWRLLRCCAHRATRAMSESPSTAACRWLAALGPALPLAWAAPLVLPWPWAARSLKRRF